MADVNTYTYKLDGDIRTFPIPTLVDGEEYLRIDVDGVELTDPDKFRVIHNALVFDDTSLLPAGSILRIITTDTIGQYASDDIMMDFVQVGIGTQLTISLAGTSAGVELSTNTDSLQAGVVTGTSLTLEFDGVNWNPV